MYLLDTNIISDLARNPSGRTARRLSEVDPDKVASSVVVAAEVWFGVEKNPSFRSRARTESFMRTVRVLELRPEVAKVYGRVRAQLSASGKTLGPNDMLIAAHALSLDATLITDDAAAFAQVPGLKMENWLRDAPADRE
ncbi:MAG: type II toxin-antitoxin system VapC family toxin [Rhizobiaceae bacterium]|nr:type II toxin-antitoxin system VapC family toxin [Rhizobiaceae bacterium]MCV0406912.1 type II toxin-antitoxin system VapC family toxin [Rhizobiaceae bacterium]